CRSAQTQRGRQSGRRATAPAAPAARHGLASSPPAPPETPAPSGSPPAARLWHRALIHSAGPTQSGEPETPVPAWRPLGSPAHILSDPRAATSTVATKSGSWSVLFPPFLPPPQKSAQPTFRRAK